MEPTLGRPRWRHGDGPVTGSRRVAWEPVHRFLAPHLGDPDLIPGTPAWCDLDDRDPRKKSALNWPVIYWAVAEDARQDAMAEASREISAAADWPAVGRRMMQRRSGVYIPRIPREVA